MIGIVAKFLMTTTHNWLVFRTNQKKPKYGLRPQPRRHLNRMPTQMLLTPSKCKAFSKNEYRNGILRIVQNRLFFLKTVGMHA